MPPNFKPNSALPMLAALLPLLTACAAPPKPLPPATVQAPTIPPLPQSAKQPTPAPLCLPNCLQAWNSEAEQWRNSLTSAVQPGKPAKEPTNP